MSFWGELRRRNVVKVAVAYAIVGWLLIQVADTFFPLLQLPEWTVTFVAALLILGFPVALLLSWAYELTPDGVKRSHHVPVAESITHVTSQKLNYVITGLVVLVLGFIVIDQYVLVDSTIDTSRQPVAETPLLADAENEPERLPNSIAVIPFSNLSPRGRRLFRRRDSGRDSESTGQAQQY